MQGVGEIVVEIAEEVGDFESVKAAEQTFDVVADLAVAVEREGLDPQRLSQRQQPVHTVFVALRTHRAVTTALEARTDSGDCDAAVGERNRMEDVALRGVAEAIVEDAAVAQ